MTRPTQPRRRRRATAGLVLAGLGAPLLLALPALAEGGSAPAAPAPIVTTTQRYVVEVSDGSLPELRTALAALGGSVTSEQSSLSTAVVSLPASAAAALRDVPGVVSVTPDAPAPMAAPAAPYDAASDAYSLLRGEMTRGARTGWPRGVNGAGVSVAVLDSGVTTVDGLSARGKVVKGVDLSYDAMDASKSFADYYGHGTHLSGIIAGHDGSGRPGSATAASDFEGVAPEARIIDVKLGDGSGHVDVSQVIAGLDWVVVNKDRLNIRVVNLSFNAGGVDDYTVDPLSFAAEQAWKRGVVVVVSAGNDGTLQGRLANPAEDPYVMAVGALDDHGTATRTDDTVPAFSARGNGVRNPDLVAPGAHLQSLLAPGSHAASVAVRLGDRFARASGTSQAAAFASGAAALLLSQRPWLTPDQVKYLLTSTAAPIPGVDERAQGHGELNLAAALEARTPGREAVQSFTPSTGLGSIEDARGDQHLVVNGNVVRGEVDAFGRAFSSKRAAAALTSDNPADLVGLVWSLVPPVPSLTGSLSGATWSGATWSGATWSGATWSGATWSGATWSSSGWQSTSWD